MHKSLFKKWCGAFLALLALMGSLPVVAISFGGMVSPPVGTIFLHDVVIGRGGGRDLHADVAYPPHLFGRTPAIIFIHGEDWGTGSYHDSPIAAFAKAGYFAASIEYRLSGEAKWPAQIQDCNLGVRWLRANAAKYKVYPDRIAVWGEGAGGHLAACVDTMGEGKDLEGNGGYPGVSSAVQAAVVYYGPTDLTTPDMIAHFGDALAALLGAPYAQNPDLWKSASPLYAIKAGDAPMFLAHGDADQLVPVSQSLIFDAALAKAGVPHQLLIIKNVGQSFVSPTGIALHPSPAEINQAAFTFLAPCLKRK